MVADEEAVIAAVITAIFLVSKEEKENREIVYKGEETHASNHGYVTIWRYVDDIVPAYPLPVSKESFRLSRSTFEMLIEMLAWLFLR